MNTKAPNSHTPQTPIVQRIKPPVITEELQRTYEIIQKVAPEAIAILQANEKRKEDEKLKNKKEFIEIAWYKLETENLWKPQNPKIKIDPLGASVKIPQAWEHNWNWYYNYPGAKAEAKYLWKKIPTQKQWEKIVEWFWDDWHLLSKKLHLLMNGYMEPLISRNYIKNVGGRYWSSSNMPSTNYGIALEFDEININPSICNDRTFGFSVRCLKKEVKKKTKKKKITPYVYLAKPKIKKK